ncbi:SDR family NAD(P)-dependent oxidoreductase [Leptolyngbya sp. AN03gr2]|uniref:SDR family NAD(P)-dependent oxidoreductase n=1 Tax=unclassified Leptolyngbya TaxID=2650499 RepID=UPI003D3152C2
MNQKICVIVGFGTGVSTGVAKAFAKEGYSLALIARNLTKLEDNAQELKTAGYPAHSFVADASDETSLRQAFNQIQAELGDPEVLVYNAFAATPGKPTSLDAEILVSDFRVNVAGALTAVQQVLPAMQANQKGTILFTGGGLALNPFADVSSLAIGKAGIRSLAFSLAQELGSHRIHVGTVTICGMVEPGTHFDPDTIAQSYIALHKQPIDAWQTEIVYQ